MSFKIIEDKKTNNVLFVIWFTDTIIYPSGGKCIYCDENLVPGQEAILLEVLNLMSTSIDTCTGGLQSCHKECFIPENYLKLVKKILLGGIYASK
ncbi:MAG: hypothetical protein M0P71_07510 [Melioribacteraceae bacterium]|jgi:hypothetical protein|nr:hypothetical protein [Melioribacteraceae bacterium]MDD3982799.1 hypothetical protein [Candidatus Omnitrophota bacterium]